ncbi:hypothetical protein K466DRAFT_588840 [Polyporus arcularius HHB13444]|uniref:DUF6533 domain-containing protein n=1 Tax=Polyporus arcularius HHB13444 TaxID=1314778 RepID=A0A5C3P8I2_9APHY|nr:hypothetical protein K466DRAFT_588840 [Polyporus arcularius HHB13444]
MSATSTSDAYTHEIAVVTKETYYVLSAFALLSFEWLITLDRETRLVWGQKATVATILFVLNRYWLFLEYITQVISIYPLSDLGCDAVGSMVIIGNAGPPYIWAVFSTLRAYALSKRKWWVIPLTMMWFIPHLVMESLYYSHLKPFEAPAPLNCVLSSTFPETEWIHLTIASRTCAIVGDLVVLVITWYSTFGIRKLKAVAEMHMRTSLTDALLKDGTLYFVCLLILNLVNIFVNVFPQTSAVTAFQDPITSILISRFILNLRDVADGNSDDLTEPSFVRHSRALGATSTVNFAEFIDPMGRDLVHGTSTRSTTHWSNDADVSEENEM